jgi:hypothetical protein
MAAASGVVASEKRWVVVPILTIIGAVGALLPSSALWAIPAMVISVYLLGYSVSYSRSVYMSDPSLPPLSSQTLTTFRRGASGTLIVLAPLLALFPLIYVAGALSLLLRDGDPIGEYAGTAVFICGVAIAVVAGLPVFARFIAFDRLGEGFRYRAAWVGVRANWGLTWRFVAYLLGISLVLGGARYAMMWAVGLAKMTQYESALSGLASGQYWRGFLYIGLVLLFQLASTFWLLVSSHLFGQYAHATLPMKASASV